MNLVYHYTYGDHMALIRAAGFIRPSAVLIDPNEKPAVHCTLSEDFEPTVLCSDVTNHRLFRIAFPAELAPLTWRQFVKSSGIRRKTARKLESVALELGSPIHLWRHSYQPIPASAWVEVEVFGP